MDIKKTIRPETIIQFGEGGFLRGFVDWMIQKLNDSGKYNGNIVVVQPIEQGMCDMLSSQDCNYTHVIRGVEGVEKTIVDSISRCVKPYEDYQAFLDLAKNPDFRVVVSNTTEAGITYIKEDKLTDTPPKSFPAKVTVLLYERFKAGLDGFIFLPCELIEKNGDNLKKIVLQYANDWNLGDEFIKFVEEKNYFCSTLVDRINTGYPKGEDLELGYEDNMVNTSEYFHLWVIESPKDFTKELPFTEIGLNVIWTEDMSMYRTRKVRILNGAHTAMVPYCMLRGFTTVRECVTNPDIRKFVDKCVFEEIIPTLDLPKEELIDYANNVLTRFENPYIKHFIKDISLNSVSKFKVRVLPSITEYIKRYNKMPETLLESFANLIKFYKVGEPNDDKDVMAFMKEASLKDILAKVEYWGEDLTYLYDEVAKYYED